MLAFASLLLTGGILGDRYGRKKMFLSGLTIFTVFSFLCGVSQNANQLIAFRVFQGVGGALLIPGTLSILTVTFPPYERAKALGHLGRRLRHRPRARPDAGRLHGRAHRLAVGLLPQRADRHRRVLHRDPHRDRVGLGDRASARRHGAGARHGGPVLRDVRVDRSEPARLGHRADRRSVHAVRAAADRVPLLGGQEPARDDAACATTGSRRSPPATPSRSAWGSGCSPRSSSSRSTCRRSTATRRSRRAPGSYR